MNKVIAEIAFNRALLFILLMHFSENKCAATLFAFAALTNMVKSVILWLEDS